MNYSDALITAVMGYAFVFLGIVLLLIVMAVSGKIMMNNAKRNKQQSKNESKPVAAAEPEKAHGTAGELKLYDTDPKTAAMIMAIVADKTGKPLNELRFKSIKEVKQ